MIRGESRRTGSSDSHSDSHSDSGTMKKTRNLRLPVLLVATTVISTFVVALATGNGVLDSNTPPMLRRGMSEASFSAKAASDFDALRFQSPELARRNVQETTTLQGNNSNTDANSFLCDVDYCQTTFNETLCPAVEAEASTLTSIPMAVQILILLVLLCFSALFSGLTLGLMSLDITGLEIVMAGDDSNAARYAKTIYPLRKQGNLLLCTLLLGNVAVNSLMAIFSAEIFSGTIGFLASTISIVIFGEIIPQALVSTNSVRVCGSAKHGNCC